MGSGRKNMASNAKHDLELGYVTGVSSGAPAAAAPSKGGERSKKLIYFSDGSTMEEEEMEDDSIEEQVCQKDGGSLQSAPGSSSVVEPSKMTWPEWIKYYSAKGGSNVVGGLENAGEKLAYFFGITTPKYQTEIDEYNRMVAKTQAEADEAKAWSGTNPSFVPIVEDPMKRLPSDKEERVEKPDESDEA